MNLYERMMKVLEQQTGSEYTAWAKQTITRYNLRDYEGQHKEVYALADREQSAMFLMFLYEKGILQESQMERLLSIKGDD